MTLKSDAKFEEKLTCSLENDMRNLTSFDLSTRKSQKFAPCSKVYNIQLKKYKGVMFDS